jgi:hypothetical protein
LDNLMPNLAFPSNQLLYSTARIVGMVSGGKSSVGTGFFFNFKIDEERVLPALITNKHVVKDANVGEFQLHKGDSGTAGAGKPTGEPINVRLEAFAERWIQHPDDNVDLCAMPVGEPGSSGPQYPAR